VWDGGDDVTVIHVAGMCCSSESSTPSQPPESSAPAGVDGSVLVVRFALPSLGAPYLVRTRCAWGSVYAAWCSYRDLCHTIHRPCDIIQVWLGTSCSLPLCTQASINHCPALKTAVLSAVINSGQTCSLANTTADRTTALGCSYMGFHSGLQLVEVGAASR
jgi:hypothetical protein